MNLEEITQELDSVKTELMLLDENYYQEEQEQVATVKELISKVSLLVSNIELKIWENNLKNK
jgi:hypothetical protein